MLECPVESMAEHATYYMRWLPFYCVYSLHPRKADIDLMQKTYVTLQGKLML